MIILQVASKRYNGIMEVSAVAVTKEELHKLIERIEDPIELESAYVAVKSIVEHDDQAWYWTERWQAEEREADEDTVVSAPFDNIRDVMRDIRRSLDELDKETSSSEHPAQKEVR